MNAEQLEKWLDEHEYQPDHFLGTVVRLQDLRALFAGKVLVPVEPTDAMIDALFPGTGAHTCRDLYQAMLAASQEQVSATAREG